MDGGFFESEGLDVQLKYSGNDDQVFATVLSGAAQFGVGDPAFTAISREKGGEGKVIAALVARVANWGVAKNPAIQAFTDPKKLNGFRVSSFPSPSTTYTILSSLKKDLNLTKMEIKQFAFGTEQAAIERKEVDIALMLEPQTSIAESQGYHVVWSLAKSYGDFMLTGVTTTDEVIKSQPETVQRFVNGLQRALTFIAKNPESSAVVLEQNFPSLKPEIVKAAMKRMVEDQTIPRTAVIQKDAWLRTLEIRKTVGDLKSLDIAEACLDVGFAKKAIELSKVIFKESPNKEIIESVKIEEHKWDWYFSIISGFASIISCLFILITYLEIAKKRDACRKFSEYYEGDALLIVNSFKNITSKVTETELLNLLVSNGNFVGDKDAKTFLNNFEYMGLIKSSKSNSIIVYAPKINIFTNSVPLFELWRNRE